MVVVMIVAFMVGWTPYAAFSILVTAHPTIHIDPRLASIPAFFSKTAAVYNPVIYVFMNKQVSESFRVRKGILHGSAICSVRVLSSMFSAIPSYKPVRAVC